MYLFPGVFLCLMRQFFPGQLQGLCGRYDGIAEMDLRQRNSDMESPAKDVASSFSSSACEPAALSATAPEEVSFEFKIFDENFSPNIKMYASTYYYTFMSNVLLLIFKKC